MDYRNGDRGHYALRVRRPGQGGISWEMEDGEAAQGGKSANLTRRHSSFRWKLQKECGEVDEMTGFGFPGV